jgi:acyl-CoA reductase-like NAD-dependent aldehyde dehydrogenase
MEREQGTAFPRLRVYIANA